MELDENQITNIGLAALLVVSGYPVYQVKVIEREDGRKSTMFEFAPWDHKDGWPPFEKIVRNYRDSKAEQIITEYNKMRSIAVQMVGARRDRP
jgi:hypothetical protein